MEKRRSSRPWDMTSADERARTKSRRVDHDDGHPGTSKTFQEYGSIRRTQGFSAHQFSSSLESLPPEIFQEIIKRLTENERACLALCNKTLLQTIGKRSWSNDSDHLDQKFAFLHLLIRNIPAWLCYRCKVIHYGRTMFPGLWHLNPMRGASWKTIVLGNARPESTIGLPYCDFDMSTQAELRGNRRIQRYSSVLAYANNWQSNLELNSTFSTITLPGGETLGHKHFVFSARYDRWHGKNVFFTDGGVDLGINLDLCKHLSLRRTQSGENIIADIMKCGWIMASHAYHGEDCSNATCRFGYKVPPNHMRCTNGADNMRHRGVCEYCPTEFVMEMWPHWSKMEKVLDIHVFHDLSEPGCDQGLLESKYVVMLWPLVADCLLENERVNDEGVTRYCNTPRSPPGLLESLWKTYQNR